MFFRHALAQDTPSDIARVGRNARPAFPSRFLLSIKFRFVIATGISVDLQLADCNGFSFRKQDRTGPQVMTPGCLVFPAAVYQDVVRLDRIMFLPDTPFSFTDFPETVFMQVLGIFLMVPADPAVKKLLPGLPLPIPAVDISGIIERFQNTVVPPLL